MKLNGWQWLILFICTGDLKRQNGDWTTHFWSILWEGYEDEEKLTAKNCDGEWIEMGIFWKFILFQKIETGMSLIEVERQTMIVIQTGHLTGWKMHELRKIHIERRFWQKKIED